MGTKRTTGNFTRVVIEEDSDSEVEIEEIVADKPPPGNFQKVNIVEEDSDSGWEDLSAAAPASTSTSKAEDTRSQNNSSNFQRVPILEDSDSEDEVVTQSSHIKSPMASP